MCASLFSNPCKFKCINATCAIQRQYLEKLSKDHWQIDNVRPIFSSQLSLWYKSNCIGFLNLEICFYTGRKISLCQKIPRKRRDEDFDKWVQQSLVVPLRIWKNYKKTIESIYQTPKAQLLLFCENQFHREFSKTANSIFLSLMTILFLYMFTF